MPLLRFCANKYRVLTVMPYSVLGQPRLLRLSAALTISGSDLLASLGGTVNYLFLVDACNAFCSSSLVLMTCISLLVGFATLRGLTEYARTVVALLLLVSCTRFMNAHFFSHFGNNMLLCLHQNEVILDNKGPHASFQACFRLSRLPDSLTLLLLCAIRLVGWLKHRHLSLHQDLAI